MLQRDEWDYPRVGLSPTERLRSFNQAEIDQYPHEILDSHGGY